MVRFHITTFALCVTTLGAVLAEDPAPIPPPSPITPMAAPATPEQPAPIEPPVSMQTSTGTGAATTTTTTTTTTAPADQIPVPAATGTAAPAPGAIPPAPETTPAGGTPPVRAVIEFQGDDLSTVFRLLARQAKISLIVSPKVQGTVTTRLENVGPLQAMDVIATSNNLIFEEQKGIYYIKTQDEKKAEPLVGGHYTFSYAIASKVKDILDRQLQGGSSQVDDRTNTVFYTTTKSSVDNVKLFLETIDKPTKQVMIEARLVEVTANPKQSYGINWGGVVGSAGAPKVFSYGATTPANFNPDGTVASLPQVITNNGQLVGQDFLRYASNLTSVGGQFSILSAPAMQLTMRLLNEDADAEFLANPRVVTANNQKATIKIIRNQPVPQLNFNEQTATAVFGGFTDKTFGNTLVVTPSINKDNFITLNVQPEISNKVADATFTFGGATVASPIIDTRTLDSSVLIKSGDTLAIGGLLQDEVTKGRTKVPILGDIPVVGYAFQERLNSRTKRNLLVFVTPTIIEQGYGTGLEDQVSGLYNSGDEYADPNGWRNNAKGAYRLVPTSNRQLGADYPKPGVAPAPDKVNYRASATNRED